MYAVNAIGILRVSSEGEIEGLICTSTAFRPIPNT